MASTLFPGTSPRPVLILLKLPRFCSSLLFQAIAIGRVELKCADKSMGGQSNPSLKLINIFVFFTNSNRFLLFLSKVWPHIVFLQGIRIWGQKIQNFRAGRGKIRKTNVKTLFSIFSVCLFDLFLKFERRVKCKHSKHQKSIRHVLKTWKALSRLDTCHWRLDAGACVTHWTD